MNAYISNVDLLVNNANFSFKGKLATLWFDKLLLGADKKLVDKVIMHVAEEEQWKSDTYKEIKKVQISSKIILPSVSFMDESVLNDGYFEKTIQICKDRYEDALSKEKTYAGAMHELLWESYGIANSVKYWTLLNAKENCTFLPTDIEKQMLSKIFGEVSDGGYSNFGDIITTIIPDISSYSWDEIIELRYHNYWMHFRKKLTELSKYIGDKKTAQDIFEEIIRKDLLEMAQCFRPQVTKNIVKGVASNIPLPIPVNPVSIACTGRDILKEINFEKKYGWLYFYIDNMNKRI